MSENRIAASTPCLRTGWSVISQVRSGVRQACSIPEPARRARYSGSERPAWRMNHTGSRDGRSPRAAARKGAAGRCRRGCTSEAGMTVMVLPSSHAPPRRHRSAVGVPRSGGAECGASQLRITESDLKSTLVSDAPAPPQEFQQAVASLRAVRPRPELLLSPLDAPPRLAPYTWAFSVEAVTEDGDPSEPDTSGRLILLHDPAGQDAWEGTFRLVCFVQARLEPEQLG